MKARGARHSPSIHQLKITLKRTKPPIWRRVQVRSTITLAELHLVVIEAMGWYGYHLHQFSDGWFSYGDREQLAEFDVRSERAAKLNQVAPSVGSKLIYEYDFGDDWEHVILVEKILPRDPKVRYPICLTGKRACPPEDCGGVWGYSELIAIMADPAHPEHATMTEWLGRPLDPDAFDLGAINRRLAGLGRGVGGGSAEGNADD